MVGKGVPVLDCDIYLIPGGSFLELSPTPEEGKWSQVSPPPPSQLPGTLWG